MYRDEVHASDDSGQVYNYEKRLEYAQDFFSELEKDGSLIFYYANKSNPFSEDEAQKYVVVGISRLKKLGDIMYYQNVAEKDRKKYAGGFVWQMPVTSHYPDEGFRIPYHKYKDREEVLSQLVVVPEVSSNFKYAARHISDDDALMYVERLMETVNTLIEIGDDTEDWQERKRWLQNLLSELWEARGPYPGVPAILSHLGFTELIEFYKNRAEAGDGRQAKEDIFNALNDRNESSIAGCDIDQATLKTYQHRWLLKLKSPTNRKFFSEVISRVDLTTEQVANVLADDREKNGIRATNKEIIDNPYLIAEQYQGDDEGDIFTFNKIDHGVVPSPELGIERMMPIDDWRRLRALCVEQLRYEQQHVFVDVDTVIYDVNRKLSFYPEWKREEFNSEFIRFYKENLEEALTIRQSKAEVGGRSFLYLNEVYDDERIIEKRVRRLLQRSDIDLDKPFSKERWHNQLYVSDSKLALEAPDAYEEAIEGQISVCQRVFRKPLCVISGEAGTGKTTVIKALLQGIRSTSGNRESFCLLAPTGKAADRIREKTGENARTIHSFLAKNGWLNANLSFKRKGGRQDEEHTTYIVDESSMLDLSLMATLFRAINWNRAKRLILVGDPNQLPPIGRGKVFADIIDFLNDIDEALVGRLSINVRQMENRVFDQGTGITELASMYVQYDGRRNSSPVNEAKVESLLKEFQTEGDVREDLRILSWRDAEELESRLLDTLKADTEGEENKGLLQLQIISPYRGELFGTEHLNEVVQTEFNGRSLERYGSLGGITLFDKVIQYVNRANRNAYWGYNFDKRKREQVDVYNGELGRVWPHAFDKENWKRPNFYVRRFQVEFARKEGIRIGFKGNSQVSENLELAYAISVHKAQGSEFERLYLILPKSKQTLLSTELLYTGITRARKHLTIFVEGDFRTFISLRRPEKAKLKKINSSLFEFNPLDERVLNMRDWYEEGKVHSTLTEFMVRSKSEVIIANMLHEKNVEFEYEKPLTAPDGTFYLPDFTIYWEGQVYYWEHVGMLDDEKYKNHWETKKAWYEKHFPDQLLATYESTDLSKEAEALIDENFLAV